MAMVNAGVGGDSTLRVVTSSSPATVPVIVNVPTVGIELEVKIAVATPLASVVAVKVPDDPGNQAREESLRVKVTSCPSDEPWQSVTVAVTTAVAPPVYSGLGATFRLRLVGMAGSLMVTVGALPRLLRAPLVPRI